MNDLCREIQEALDELKPVEALRKLLDRVEVEQTSTMREVYDALISFLPTNDDARYDVIIEEIDSLIGWCHESAHRWPSEPRIHDTVESPRPTRVVIGVLDMGDHFQRKYLVGRRAGAAYHGCWEFPGGKREHPETSEETLIREWKEELDVDITVGSRVFTGRFTTVDLQDFIALAFQITRMDGTPAPSTHSEFAVLTKAEILGLPDAEVTPSLKPITQSLKW